MSKAHDSEEEIEDIQSISLKVADQGCTTNTSHNAESDNPNKNVEECIAETHPAPQSELPADNNDDDNDTKATADEKNEENNYPITTWKSLQNVDITEENDCNLPSTSEQQAIDEKMKAKRNETSQNNPDTQEPPDNTQIENPDNKDECGVSANSLESSEKENQADAVSKEFEESLALAETSQKVTNTATRTENEKESECDAVVMHSASSSKEKLCDDESESHQINPVSLESSEDDQSTKHNTKELSVYGDAVTTTESSTAADQVASENSQPERSLAIDETSHHDQSAKENNKNENTECPIEQCNSDFPVTEKQALDENEQQERSSDISQTPMDGQLSTPDADQKENEHDADDSSLNPSTLTKQTNDEEQPEESLVSPKAAENTPDTTSENEHESNDCHTAETNQLANETSRKTEDENNQQETLPARSETPRNHQSTSTSIKSEGSDAAIASRPSTIKRKKTKSVTALNSVKREVNRRLSEYIANHRRLIGFEVNRPGRIICQETCSASANHAFPVSADEKKRLIKSAQQSIDELNIGEIWKYHKYQMKGAKSPHGYVQNYSRHAGSILRSMEYKQLYDRLLSKD